MKLISLNVALFEANNHLLTKFLHEHKADFVCLQEITRSLEDGVDKAYVSKDVVDTTTKNLPYFFFGPNSIMGDFEQKNFHGKEIYRFEFGGLMEFGNYTKSHYKIVKAQNVFVQNSFTYSTDFSKWPDEDYRAVLITDHIVQGKKIRILNYHGVWTRHKQGNKMSLSANKIINELALKAEGEVIICGDFNLFPDTPSMNVFEKNFTSLVNVHNIRTTRPSTNELHASKRNVVDYILVSKGIRVKQFEVIESNVSDHLPLVLDFELEK
ncbi:MAG: endonuclease/exonuclease/phosphatase family protein [bacterium]